MNEDKSMAVIGMMFTGLGGFIMGCVITASVLMLW